MLRSLRMTNPDTHVIVFYDELNATQRRLFSGYDLRHFDLGRFGAPKNPTPSRPEIDSSTFLRFGIEDVHDFDVALYLDCDTVVLDDLDSVFSLPGHMVATPMPAPSLAEHFRDPERILRDENISPALSAVNAGVIKFDTAYWRETGLGEQALHMANTYGWDAFTYGDQAILNLVGYRTGALRPMSKLYNFMWWPYMRERNHTLSENGNGLCAPLTDEGLAAVVHWTGPIKPWHQSFREMPIEDQRLYCGPCYDQFAE